MKNEYNYVMRILLIEDDPMIGRGLHDALRRESMSVDWVTDGHDGLEALKSTEYMLCLLDLGLPGLSGTEILRLARQSGSKTPAMMITARDALDDRVAGLDLGADDYLVKPFELPELVARIRALSLRRSGQASRLQVADLIMDLSTRKVSRNGQELHLSPTGWTLLECLMRASPAPVNRERLEAAIWGDELPDSNTLKVHMHRLRKAVDKDFETALILTLPGIGVQLGSSCAKD